MKITLEAPGHNTQILTDETVKELGALGVCNLIIGWMSMFYIELYYYFIMERDDHS